MMGTCPAPSMPRAKTLAWGSEGGREGDIQIVPVTLVKQHLV